MYIAPSRRKQGNKKYNLHTASFIHPFITSFATYSFTIQRSTAINADPVLFAFVIILLVLVIISMPYFINCHDIPHSKYFTVLSDFKFNRVICPLNFQN